MKKFKAMVKNKATGERETIVSEYNTKTEFISDLRANGYAVTDYEVKEEHIFDWIMKNTNGHPWDWKENN